MISGEQASRDNRRTIVFVETMNKQVTSFTQNFQPFVEDTKKPLKKAFDGFTLENELQTCFSLTSVFHLHPDIQKRKRKVGIALVIDHYIHT
jgi:hypothetical protein